MGLSTLLLESALHIPLKVGEGRGETQQLNKQLHYITIIYSHTSMGEGGRGGHFMYIQNALLGFMLPDYDLV